jgi:Galactose-3-O-sulfotransferase
MSEVYIFHHVFKTGGTSFNLSYVPGAFSPGEAFVLGGSEPPNSEDLRRAIAFSNDERARLKLIAGHNTGELRPFYPKARYLSLVRDPVERSLSAYLHYKHHPETWERTGRMIHENNIGVAEFVEANWFNKAHNLQTRLLLGPEFMTSEPRDDASVTAAIRARFHLIGYTEALEKFLFYLHLADGFPLVLFNKRLVRRERGMHRPAPEDFEAIERHNRLDRAFYRCARAEFDRKVAEVWTAGAEELFRRYTSATELYRTSTNGDPNAIPLPWSRSEGGGIVQGAWR